MPYNWLITRFTQTSIGKQSAFSIEKSRTQFATLGPTPHKVFRYSKVSSIPSLSICLADSIMYFALYPSLHPARSSILKRLNICGFGKSYIFSPCILQCNLQSFHRELLCIFLFAEYYCSEKSKKKQWSPTCPDLIFLSHTSILQPF